MTLKLAFRLLGRNPALAASAILVIAFGIGTTTVTFAVADGILLRPAAVPTGRASWPLSFR